MVAITCLANFLPEKVHSRAILFSCLLRAFPKVSVVQHLLHLGFPQYAAQERSQNLLKLWSSFFFPYSKAGNLSFSSLARRSGYIPASSQVGKRQDALSERAVGTAPATRNNPLPAESRAQSMGQQRTSLQEIPYCKATGRIKPRLI